MAVSDIQSAYDEALAELAKQQREMFTDYGFSGSVDDAGKLDFSIDPNLQYGLSQNTLRSHANALQQNRFQNVGRGLGRSGLSKQRDQLLRFLQGGDIANLGTRFTRGINDIVSQRAKAKGLYNRGMADAGPGTAGPPGGGVGGPPPGQDGQPLEPIPQGGYGYEGGHPQLPFMPPINLNDPNASLPGGLYDPIPMGVGGLKGRYR